MIKFVLSLYVFLSVNDLVLYAVNALQLKNALLVLTLVLVFFGSGRMYKSHALILCFLMALLLVSIMVGLTVGNEYSSVFQQAFSVAVAILVPVMISRFAGSDNIKWTYVSNVVLISLISMILFKIIFVLYQMGYISNGILDLLFQNIQGRGEMEGIVRLNTGTQLLMLYGLVLGMTRLLKSVGARRAMYIIVCIMFAFDLFIASSRFFTLVAPLTVIVTLLFCNIKIPKSMAICILICVVLVAGFLLQDLYSARVMVDDGGDNIRDDQTKLIIGAFTDSPLFGHGSGFSLPSLTRNDDAPFMYEVQIFAFLMQFGILGMFLYTASMVQLLRSHLGEGLVLLAVFYVGVFFSASYFNPYMLGTYAGLSLAMINIILRDLSVNKFGVRE
jgi:hypothetical protein